VRIIKVLAWLGLAVYMLVLFQFLVLDRWPMHRYFYRSYSLTPFRSIQNYIKYKDSYNYHTWWMNLYGNLLMLTPLGVLLPLISAWFRRSIVFVGSLLIFNLGIEAMQYMWRLGSFDIDDIILNSFGALLAYGAARLFMAATNVMLRTKGRTI
jgi:glycopeptide antibiotics resistance protein